jgi:flavin reductase (DIM6/NTAB) family NADH-FMN oxidoreductase RutF
MDFPAAGIAPQAIYKLITGIVVPRPIAWVTTVSPGGHVNLAPFSAFTFVSNAPPMVSINVGRKAGVRRGPVEHPRHRRIRRQHRRRGDDRERTSAIEYAPDISESRARPMCASIAITTPRLSIAPIALECRFERAIAFGRSGSEFMVGEVVHFHVRDGLLEDGRIDTAKLRPICRIGGPRYAQLGEIVTMTPIAQTSK